MSKIMPLPNWFNNTHDNLFNSLDDDFNTKTPAKSMEIYMLSNNIPSPKKRERGFNEEKNFLKNRLQGYQQYYEILPSSFGA